MSLNDFSNIVVSAEGAALTEVGFGTLLLAGYHTHWTERTRVYTSLTEMTDDSFDTDEPLYVMAQRAFAQKPRVSRIKVGRLALAPVMTQRLTPIAVNSATYAITIHIEDEDPVDISVTADASATVDEICDLLETAINAAALTGLTVTPSGATATHLDLSATAGLVFWLSGWDNARIKVEDRTPDPGIATDLDAIRTEDADWYGLALSVNSAAILEEAADWAETQDVILGGNTSDWTALDPAQTVDIGSVLMAKSYARTILGFDLDDQEGYMGVAMLAERFPFDPGSPPSAGGVFHAKTLRGVTADALTPTQKTNVRAKRYVPYITTAGRAHTLDGKTPSGEYLDFTRFVDWYRIRLQEKLAAGQLNNGRIPYDDRGIAMIANMCQAQLNEGLASGGISPTDAEGNPPSVSVPKLTDTAQNDRAGRVLRNARTSFKYAGAIQFVDPVTITVTQ